MIMSTELAEGVRRMLADAYQRGLAVELRHRPAAHSLEEAADLLGIPPSDMAKTIVVRRSTGNYLFALIPGDTTDRLAETEVAARRQQDEVARCRRGSPATGYERGTITPIGSEPKWPVIIDERLVGRRAALGAGTHGYSAFVVIDDLARAYDATVADIAS